MPSAGLKVHDSFKFLSKIHQQNQDSLTNQWILLKFITLLEFVANSLIYYYATAGVMATAMPIALSMMTDIKEYIIPIELPGLPLNNAWQYPLNLGYQACFVPNALFYVYFDFMLVVQVMHVILMTAILNKKLRSINRMIARRHRRNRRIDLELNFRNIILLHNELIG